MFFAMKKLFPVLVSLSLLVMPSVAMADTTPPSTTTTTVPVQRIYGLDRYQTATAVADQLAKTWGIDYAKGQQFQAMVLASGNNWPDAICGAPLAELVKGPILLLDNTPGSSGSQTTWSYMQAHVAKTAKVFILGGTGVIPQSFTDHLVGMGFLSANIQQIGGINRDETSYLIAKQVNLLGTSGGALVVSDAEFYDALTVSGVDASGDVVPILLIPPKGPVPSDEKKYADSIGLQPVGNIVSSISSVLPGANVMFPVNGGGEYATNRAFIENIGFETPTIFIATGEDYPDALTGAVLGAAGQNQPTEKNGYTPLPMQFVLVGKNSLSPDTSAILNEITWFDKTRWLKPGPGPVSGWGSTPAIYPNPKLVILGGPGAVSDNVENQVVQIMSGPGQPMSN